MQIGEYPKEFRIIEGGPWWLPEPPFETAHENPMHPLAEQLREKFKLDHVIEGGKTEFEKFLLLKEWVKRQMRQHGWSFNCLKELPGNALEILEYVEKGTLFHCLFHAKVFIQCCEALGYPARLVGARTTNLEFPGERTGNVGHEISEVWSNEYRKWVLMDCDTNSYYEKGKIPLSISELCLEKHRDGGESVEMVFGEYRPSNSVDTGHGAKVLGTDRTPDEVRRSEKVFMHNRAIDYYSIVLVNNRHDVFSNRYKKPEILSFAPEGIYPLLVYNNDPYVESDLWTDDSRIFNWSVNEVAVDLKVLDNENSYPPLVASFKNSMPNFDRYEISTDGGASWKQSSSVMRWELKEGKNRLWVCGVNTMGIRGPVSKAVVIYKE